MKKHVWWSAALALFLLVSSSLRAQTGDATYTISGTVTWKGSGHTGEPVVGASVRIGPGNYSTTTDAQGRYVLTGVKPGPHTIHIKATRPNGSVTKAVTVSENKVVDITVRYRNVAVRRRNGGVGVQKQ